MVVFTCGHCGEAVNKPKVQKHYQTKCRNRNPNLSCMDCFKDFLGNDYEAHTKCITEEERYAAKGFQAKEKKGEKKQNAWVEMLQSVLDEQKTASKNVLRIIETISKHNNTPRKKPKFINFVKNVCGAKTNPKDIDQAWELISVKLSALSNSNKQVGDLKETSNVVNGEENEDKNTSLNGSNHDNKENEEELNQENKVNDNKSENNANEEGNVKLSKKQRKEERKRLKYEAELQAASVETEEPEPVDEIPNKNKKNKNKIVENGHNDIVTDGKGKNKKRKRLDTVPTIESNDKEVPTVEKDINKAKVTKKKPKTDEENEAEESLCLHDQNVAQSEITESNEKFNWHAVIVSVLQKKGNEVPFKRLQKKVLNEYIDHTGNEVDDRIADKFIKKLKSAPNVKVDKNRVILIDE